jgi:hypothetical protein
MSRLELEEGGTPDVPLGFGISVVAKRVTSANVAS